MWFKQPQTANTKWLFAGIAVAWFFILEMLSRTFFPNIGTITWQQKATIGVQFGCFALYLGLGLLAKKFPSNGVLRVLSSAATFWLLFMSNTLVGFESRPGVSGFFVHNAVMFCGGVTFVMLWLKHSIVPIPTIIRVLCVVLIGLVSLGLVQAFGSRQFRSIPKTFGGGQPDLAWLKLAPSATNLAAATGTTTSNGLFGPVAILMQTDRSLICLRPKSLQSPHLGKAFELNRELVEALVYLPRVPMETLTCCERARKAGTVCRHYCCEEARTNGLVCTVCNPWAQLQQ
jgi:hypothetical protein